MISVISDLSIKMKLKISVAYQNWKICIGQTFSLTKHLADFDVFHP